MKRIVFAWCVLGIASLAVIMAALNGRTGRVFARLPPSLPERKLHSASKPILENRAVFVGNLETASNPPHACSLEEGIVANPFAVKTARIRMRRRLDREDSAEEDIPDDRGDMGWALPDRKYWKTIPAEARRIPTDLSGLPMVRFTNTEIDGERRIWLQEGPEWDQWVLRDAEHDVWACISVEHSTRRIYFREMSPWRNGGWRLRRGQDNCYSCHPSGPRVIRPFRTDTVKTNTLGEFNRRILSYGACDFSNSVDIRLRGKPMSDGRCIGCHNGTRRGHLYAIHNRVVRFKTKWEQSMPPKPISF